MVEQWLLWSDCRRNRCSLQLGRLDFIYKAQSILARGLDPVFPLRNRNGACYVTGNFLVYRVGFVYQVGFVYRVDIYCIRVC